MQAPLKLHFGSEARLYLPVFCHRPDKNGLKFSDKVECIAQLCRARHHWKMFATSKLGNNIGLIKVEIKLLCMQHMISHLLQLKRSRNDNARIFILGNQLDTSTLLKMEC